MILNLLQISSNNNNNNINKKNEKIVLKASLV